MLVLAIDVGIKNLAFCAMDSHDGIIEWANEALSAEAYTPMHNVQYVHEFIARHTALFERADRIVVEKQMRVNMRIIEAVIQSRFYDKCKVVHARSMKVAYGIGRGNYALNKKASVEFVESHLTLHGEPEWRAHFASAKKRDDLADAYVMALFFSGGGMTSKPCAMLGMGRSQEPLKNSKSSTLQNCLPCGSTFATSDTVTPSPHTSFST